MKSPSAKEVEYFGACSDVLADDDVEVELVEGVEGADVKAGEYGNLEFNLVDSGFILATSTPMLSIAIFSAMSLVPLSSETPFALDVRLAPFGLKPDERNCAAETVAADLVEREHSNFLSESARSPSEASEDFCNLSTSAARATFPATQRNVKHVTQDWVQRIAKLNSKYSAAAKPDKP